MRPVNNVGSCFSMHRYGTVHAGSMESTREVQELLKAIIKRNSSLLIALHTSQHSWNPFSIFVGQVFYFRVGYVDETFCKTY